MNFIGISTPSSCEILPLTCANKLVIAVYNGPESHVVSGEMVALESFIAHSKYNGIKTSKLRVSQGKASFDLLFERVIYCGCRVSQSIHSPIHTQTPRVASCWGLFVYSIDAASFLDRLRYRNSLWPALEINALGMLFDSADLISVDIPLRYITPGTLFDSSIQLLLSTLRRELLQFLILGLSRSFGLCCKVWLMLPRLPYPLLPNQPVIK